MNGPQSNVVRVKARIGAAMYQYLDITSSRDDNAIGPDQLWQTSSPRDTLNNPSARLNSLCVELQSTDLFRPSLAVRPMYIAHGFLLSAMIRA